MYKATNIDTDKALQAIEDMQCNKIEESERERYALRKYYEGIDKGLELAKGIFYCSNYEKECKENDQNQTEPLSVLRCENERND